MIEVVTGSGVAYSCHEAKETPPNSWMKLCSVLWEINTGVFREHEPYDGSKCIYYTKKKVSNYMLTSFKGKYEKDVKTTRIDSIIYYRNKCMR